MRNKHLIIISLALFLFFLISCKKEKSENPNSLSNICLSETFQVNLNEIINVGSAVEDNNGNTIILGDSASVTKIIKLDPKGNLLWEKYYPTIQGTRRSIITLNDNSIIFSSSTLEKTILSDIFLSNGCIFQTSSSISFLPDCQHEYEFGEYGSNYKYSGKSFLTKLDSNGNLLWTKECDGYTGGRNMVKTSQENILLLGYLSNGMNPMFVYDSYGIFQDTVIYPNDENILYLHQFDQNGNIVWSKTLNNIEERLYGGEGAHCLVYSNSVIAISTPDFIIFLDHSGNEIKRFVPVTNSCKNEIYSFEKADDSNFYISGQYYYVDSEYNLTLYPYLAKINSDGNVIWKNDVCGYLTYVSDNSFVLNGTNVGSFYNSNGSIIWSSDFLKNCPISKCCNGGIISLIPSYGNIKVTKTDENGSF